MRKHLQNDSNVYYESDKPSFGRATWPGGLGRDHWNHTIDNEAISWHFATYCSATRHGRDRTRRTRVLHLMVGNIRKIYPHQLHIFFLFRIFYSRCKTCQDHFNCGRPRIKWSKFEGYKKLGSDTN